MSGDEIGAALVSLRAAVDTLLDADFEALDEAGFYAMADVLIQAVIVHRRGAKPTTSGNG